jgi:hypothetical protein
LNPTDPEITGAVVKSAEFLVANRTGPRVP